MTDTKQRVDEIKARLAAGSGCDERIPESEHWCNDCWFSADTQLEDDEGVTDEARAMLQLVEGADA